MDSVMGAANPAANSTVREPPPAITPTTALIPWSAAAGLRRQGALSPLL